MAPPTGSVVNLADRRKNAPDLHEQVRGDLSG